MHGRRTPCLHGASGPERWRPANHVRAAPAASVRRSAHSGRLPFAPTGDAVRKGSIGGPRPITTRRSPPLPAEDRVGEESGGVRLDPARQSRTERTPPARSPDAAPRDPAARLKRSCGTAGPAQGRSTGQLLRNESFPRDPIFAAGQASMTESTAPRKALPPRKSLKRSSIRFFEIFRTPW